MYNNKSKPEYSEVLQAEERLFSNDPNLEKVFRSMSSMYEGDVNICKGMIEQIRLAFKIISENAEIIEPSFFDTCVVRYKELIIDILSPYSIMSDDQWKRDWQQLQKKINNVFGNFNNLITNNSFINAFLLYFQKQSALNGNQINELLSSIRTIVNDELRKNYPTLQDEINKLYNSMALREEKSSARYSEVFQATKTLYEQIKIKSEELDKKFDSITIQASIENIEGAKKKTTLPLWIFGFISFSALCAVLYLIWHSYNKIDTTFDYVVSHFNEKQIELQKMYLIKNSLITLSAIALFSGIFTYSLKILKSYLNIRTAYNHKLALLSSFDNLVGKDILNSQERHTITETLIKQIISGDNISLGDNQSSSPSIVQSIIEKLPSSDKPN